MQRRRVAQWGFLALLLLLGGVFVADPTLAQEVGNLETFAQQAGFGTQTNITQMIARLIRTVVGFAGVILVVYLIYGGVLWMTAGGNTDRLKRAKNTIINGIIGLVICLSTFGIVQFAISFLDFGGGGGGVDVQDDADANGGPFNDGNRRSRGAFVLKEVNTACSFIQNIQLQFLFSESVRESTIIDDEGIIVSVAGGSPVEGTFLVRGARVSFVPTETCDEEGEIHCFAPQTQYTATIRQGIVKSRSGRPLTCNGEQPCEHTFTTGRGFDTQPPTLVEMNAPENGARVIVGNGVELLQAETKDDRGVSSVAFDVDGEIVFDAGITDSDSDTPIQNNSNFFRTNETQWETEGYATNRRYRVQAEALDCAGYRVASSPISVTLRSANCGNGVLDAELGETGIDCGGSAQNAFFCGACEAEVCEVDDDCAQFHTCQEGQCVSTAVIQRVTPNNGAPGNLITISGGGFGELPGRVIFEGVVPEDEVIVTPYVCSEQVKWSPTEIIVQLPEGAYDGPIRVQTNEGATDDTQDANGPHIQDFDFNDIVRPGLCAVDPSSTQASTQVSLLGQGLGDERASSSVYVGRYAVSNYPNDRDWSNDRIDQITVPLIRANRYDTQIFVGENRCENSQELCGGDYDCDEEGGRCLIGRQPSNPVSLRVLASEQGSAPVISFVDSGWQACSQDGARCGSDVDCPGQDNQCVETPSRAPSEHYITLFGSNFGSSTGRVLFVNNTDGNNNGQQALALTDFPQECGGGFWQDDRIVVKVPLVYNNQVALDVGAHQLIVERQQDAARSEPLSFDVINGEPGPSLCQIVPSSGPPQTSVTLIGETLGSSEGEVTFFREQSASFGVWRSGVVEQVLVPPAAQSGPVSLTHSNGFRSNALSFVVADCRESENVCGEGERCCGDGTCRESCTQTAVKSHFAYRFSTAPIPDNPEVAVACDALFRSPSPWRGFSEATCVNAQVTASFVAPRSSEPIAMDPNTFTEESIQVFECLGGGPVGCDERSDEPVAGSVISRAASSFVWAPQALWRPETVYQVVLKGEDVVGAIRSREGGFLARDFVWEFKTASSDTFCQVGGVHVDPARFTAVDQNETVGYVAQPTAAGDRCQVLSCTGLSLDWSSSFDGATLAFGERNGICDNTVTAVQETPVGQPAEITATITNTNEIEPPSDTALLTIDFLDPKVVSTTPACGAACVNATVRARFNTRMRAETLSPATVNLYRCRNALCESGALDAVEILGVNCSDEACGQDGSGRQFDVRLAQNLTANTHYRVVLSGGILSQSGVALSRGGSNFGEPDNLGFAGAYSWRFKTKNDSVSCRVDRVRVRPSRALMSLVGDRQEFYADAFGAPDECSTTGQLLDPTDYVWQPWRSVDRPDLVEGADVAGLLQGGAIVLTSDLPRGCSGACTHTGSAIVAGAPVCGNGVVEAGEDCEPGPGCSQSCVKLGSAVCALTCSNQPERTCTSDRDCSGNGTCQTNGVNCCGNGVLETAAGEECDTRGNALDGDGCSSVCLNEGSRAIGSICGDGTRDFEENRGGEDCDDGNNRGADGCSALCLNEGTIPIAFVYATCGNGVIEAGEDCETGPGCSAQCLNEGTRACVFVCSNEPGRSCRASTDCRNGGLCQPVSTPCCGNGGNPEPGEDCDGTQGCSASCLSKGSSAFYSTASFCGDTQRGIGEECEAARLDRGVLSPYAVAQVLQTAPQEVIASDTQQASARISTRAEIIEGEATLSLQCACTSDASCGAEASLGCGVAHCCFARPQIDRVSPAHNSSGLCRNSALSIDVSQPVLEETLNPPNATDPRPHVYVELRRIGDVLVNEQNQQNCPDSYLRATVPTEPSENLLVRLWGWIRSLFGRPASAERFACLLPVSYELTALGQGQTIHLNYQELLKENAVYRIAFVGDSNASDGRPEGVLSKNGVSFAFRGGSGKFVTQFETSDQVCELDEVTVVDLGRVDLGDLDDPSVGVFRKTGETHAFEAQAVSLARAPLRTTLEPIPGVYDWAWAWNTQHPDDGEGDVISAVQANERTTTARAVGNNGEEIVSATARVTDRRDPVTPVESSVTGGKRVRAFLCENTWPALEQFPYHETSTNFSFFYCRDRGQEGPLEDLPPMNIVDVPQPLQGIFKEYLYTIAGASDALGVRVVPNPNYLSPLAWYKSQGFTGSPKPVLLDGYQAVREGNTLYVAAANRATDQIYPNMYIISFNEGAAPESQEIFEAILDSWEFNANTEQVSDWRVCVSAADSDEFVLDQGRFISCSWDGECPVNARCFADKSQLTRDTKRLSDLVTIRTQLASFGSRARHCSVTKNLTCVSDGQCPGEEICLDDVPALSSGTYIRTMSVSTWPSWTAEFGNALSQGLPEDPLNTFRTCPEGFDQTSCYSAEQNQFICSRDSHVYAFQSSGAEAYTLRASLEYDAARWAHPIDQDTRRFPDQTKDNAQILVEFAADGSPGGFIDAPSSSFCSGQAFGNSRVCGDGVRGTGDNAEPCEIGDVERVACSTFVCANANFPSFNGQLCSLVNPACGVGGTCVPAQGTKARACINDEGECRYQTEQESPSSCVPYRCGNGFKEPGETCDDGPLNGTYGHCGLDCSARGNVFFCGDGTLGGGEQCDAGDQNGQYSQNYDDSCAFDCSFPGPSCGDREVNGGEQCDGNTERHNGKLCSAGAINQPCETNSDCGVGGVCGGTPATLACAPSRVCETGLVKGKPCANNDDCTTRPIQGRPPVVGECGAFARPLTRTRVCSAQCSWPAWQQVGGSTCLAQSFCGDGNVDGEEVCDDGNRNNNDACRNDCRLNVCGDGYRYDGVESCDAGDFNGQRCQAPYGNTCNYCNNSCEYQTVSGAYCGDQVINGNELCDGSAIKTQCVTYGQNGEDAEVGGSCNPADLEGIRRTCGEPGFAGCGIVKICNGGTRNGFVCGSYTNALGGNPDTSLTSLCVRAGGVCVDPVCAPNCASSCPTNYQTVSLLAYASNNPNNARQVIDLFSSNSGVQPDAASLQIPACRIATALEVDIDKSNVSPPSLDIIFVTDLSGSMNEDPQGNTLRPEQRSQSRISIVSEALIAGVDDLFRTYESVGASDRIRVSLISYRASKEFRDSADDEGIGENDQHGFVGPAFKQDLFQIIREYPNRAANGTPTISGVAAALADFEAEKERLGDDQVADQRIIVLLSDGAPSVPQPQPPAPERCGDVEDCVELILDQVNDGKEQGILFYTAAITDRSSLRGYMAHWSSNVCGTNLISSHDCAPRQNVQYAFSAETSQEIQEMYGSIINSIIGSVATLITERENESFYRREEVRDGPGVSLPIPPEFSCNGTPNQFIPFSLTFRGDGPARLSNFQFTYCPAR